MDFFYLVTINPVQMFFAIPILVIAMHILMYFSNKLYYQFYAKHIAIEGYKISPFSWHIKKFIINAIILSLGPLLLWVPLVAIENNYFYVLCGIIIGFLCVPLTQSIGSIVAYLFIKYYPKSINGLATFSMGAYRIILISIAIQKLLLLGIVAFFIRSPFIIGMFLGVAIWVIVPFLIKNSQPIV